MAYRWESKDVMLTRDDLADTQRDATGDQIHGKAAISVAKTSISRAYLAERYGPRFHPRRCWKICVPSMSLPMRPPAASG